MLIYNQPGSIIGQRFSFSLQNGLESTLFDPSEYAALVVSWLSAKFANVSTDGATVVTAPDHGGIAGIYTAGANTLYRTNQINEMPAYQFDGIAANLVSGNVNHSIGTGDFWMGWISKAIGGSSDVFCIGNALLEVLNYGTNLRCDNFGINAGLAFDTSFFTAVELWRQLGTVNLTVNGSIIATVASSFSLPNNAAFNFCGNPGAGFGFANMLLAEGLILKNPTWSAGLPAISVPWRAQYGM